LKAFRFARASAAAQRWRLAVRTRILTGLHGLTRVGLPAFARAVTVPVQYRADDQRRRQPRQSGKLGNGTGEIHSIVSAATSQSVTDMTAKSILGNCR
jgi:hypothetical protein